MIHDGDFKSGSDRCDDATFEDRLHRFQASAHPFVFIPGDSEWTDCHRENNGAYEPLERLTKLRGMFPAPCPPPTPPGTLTIPRSHSPPPPPLPLSQLLPPPGPLRL